MRYGEKRIQTAEQRFLWGVTIMKKSALVPALLIVSVSVATGDFLVSSRRGTLKRQPVSSSPVVAAVDRNDTLVLISQNQKNGYYHAKRKGTPENGWIYRTLVRRFRSPPIAESDSGRSPGRFGYPKSIRETSDFKILKNTGYWVGYSELRKNPLWSSYRLFRMDNPVSSERPRRFRVDDRTGARITHEDYTGTNYDRGHMAPNSGICTRFGKEAQRETFLMSNICPQCPGLNRETWQAFEKIETDFYSNEFGEVWVVTGPVFPKKPDTLPCGVAIPDRFYKIIVDEDEQGNLFMLGIIMSQCDRGERSISDFIATVDSIESVTGLDFFSELPDPLENRLECSFPDDTWEIDMVLRPVFSAGEQKCACRGKTVAGSRLTANSAAEGKPQ